MASWRRKKGAEGETPVEETQAAQSPAPKKKQRKPNEMLASVVDESTVGPAVDILKDNEKFALPNDKGWVILALSTDAIDGLGKKHSNNEAKGSILQLIKSDQLQVISTQEMLAEEFLGLIPSEDTLSRMSEFSLLTDVTDGYYWALVTLIDDGEKLDVKPFKKTTFQKAQAISRSQVELSDEIPEMWAWAEGTTAPVADEGVESTEEAAELVSDEQVEVSAAEDTTEVPAVAEESAETPVEAVADEADEFGVGEDEGVDYNALSEEDDTGSVEGFDEDLDADAIGDAESWGETEDTGGYVDDEVADEEPEADDSVYGQYLDKTKDATFTEVDVRDTIARRFLSDDVDVNVDLAEFEVVFNTAAPVIELEIANDPSDWLGSQVAQLARQANAEIALAHRNNIAELRQSYVDILSMHSEEVIKKVSLTREDTVFYALNKTANEEFAAAKQEAQNESLSQRREIQERFEREADDRAQAAAAMARQQFKDRNSADLERRLGDVSLEIDRRNEERHAGNRQRLLEMRRSEASNLMSLGATRTFQVLAEREAKMRDAEMALLKEWNAKIGAFIDENRKNDVARSQALAEQLAQSTQVETLIAEQTQRVEELRGEHADRVRKLEAEIVRNRERAAVELKEREAALGYEIQVVQSKLDTEREVNEKLTKQFASVRDDVKAGFEERVETLVTEKESYGRELERANHIQSRMNWVLVVLVVVLGIAALAVGIIFGWTAGLNSSADGMILPAVADTVWGSASPGGV